MNLTSKLDRLARRQVSPYGALLPHADYPFPPEQRTAPSNLAPAFGVRGMPALFALATLCTALTTQAAVPFTLILDGNANTPRIRVVNESRYPIVHFELTIGDLSKNFDSASTFSGPAGSTFTVVHPDGTNGGLHSDLIEANLTGFAPGTTISFYTDVDSDSSDSGENYRTVLFNNGDALNAVVRVRDEVGNTEELSLPDPGAADLSSYTFQSKSRSRSLSVKSVSEEGATDYVKKVQVKINGLLLRTNTSGNVILGTNTAYGVLFVGEEEFTTVYDDEVVEVIAPQQVYKDITGADITDSVEADPDNILHFAEERFTAIGVSVNNIAQTGDPTYYRFTVAADSNILVKWQHDFALSISHDFAATASAEAGYAGPLNSEAEGNPQPPAPKTWVRKGTIVSPTVDGQVLDLSSHPGLDIRYINKGYRAGGAANRANPGPLIVGTNFVENVYAWAEQGISLPTNALLTASLLTPPARQQVAGFTMSGPARIVYVWQIQYGVHVNMDSLTRAAIPRVFSPSPTNANQLIEAAAGEGTFWFNPGDSVRIASLATVDALALSGWFNGDGFYFGANGGVNPVDGSLTASGSIGTNTAWQARFSFGGLLYDGLDIPQLHRPARVLWTYGNPGLAVTATIGEYVFEDDATNANAFITPPDAVIILNISGANQTVGAADATVWDEQAQRLYPLVPGQYRVTWRRGVAPDQATNDVILTVHFPATAHYPHIAGAPGVALDPDPNDNFIFKAIKYTENSASVDGSGNFYANASGHTVLQFGNIQRVGRSEPREFVAIRVVETKDYHTVLDYGEGIIGQKLTASDLDEAQLGTGYVLSFADNTGQPDRQRFNPFIYDASKLTGLAAKDIYDMGKLTSTTQAVEVLHRELLPGPIIPVNLHPGAEANDRIIVVWYANPAHTDTLLWPARARSYTNRWPLDASEGLGRITVASQFGSESQVIDNNGLIADQVIVPETLMPGVGTLPAETTFNPSRFQQVQVYNQPDLAQRGYNPNEEHALIAPSLRYAAVSPRPPAVYALRANDLNQYSSTSETEQGQSSSTYSSHPYVLVQYFDTAESQFKMRVYQVFKEQLEIPGYRFANQTVVTTNGNGVVSASPQILANEPHVTMIAGEPVIPFYPLGVVIGASPCPQTFGVNLKGQAAYWEDHKGTSWAISGGENAWFTVSFSYPLQPDFWWPLGKPGVILDNNGVQTGIEPQAGDCVSFLPSDVAPLLASATNTVLDPAVVSADKPNKILYQSDWPAVAPILKAGETLTFSGGEYRADHPTIPAFDAEGNLTTVQTPGLPAIVGFAEAEVVFDSLNPAAINNLWRSSWTARVVQALDVRAAPLSLANFPAELAPASGRTRVKNGKYVFNDLPASLQKRLRYDPLLGKLEFNGLLNDKDIGEATLTAPPPAVYVLEPNILTADDRDVLQALDENQGSSWDTAVAALFAQTRNPNALVASSEDEYLAGLEQEIIRNPTTGLPLTQTVAGMVVPQRNPSNAAPYRAFGPGLALIPNGGFLDPYGIIPPNTPFPDISWVTVAENNDDALGGSPVTIHVIKVDRHERYRGAIKTITSDNVFDENLVLRHTGDFGANAGELAFEWWYRTDDGSLNVPPPDLMPAGQTSPWKLFPDPTGKRGVGRYLITLKGNPNAPETLLADTFWFCRYRHVNDTVQGTDWNVTQLADNSPRVNFTWAGAGNSDPLHDYDLDGLPDYRAQLAQGWIKRVLDAVNPYEARIRDFDGDSPSTISSIIEQLGPRFEGPVALNPDKDVIENVGLIELYETILKRGRDLSIDLSRPVSTPAIANALELASTRLADFYTLLGNEAYADAQDPTIGFGSDSVEYGSLAPAVFCFQNQVSSLLEEELDLLRGVDDYYARPVYNRLFWNFTQGEGTAAYALSYNISDVNRDGFIDENDAMLMHPQGHGDAWGHYLTALTHQYDLLRHPYFNWVSRSEFYNLQDIVIKVDFLDERKFAQEAAAKAKVGAEILNLTYRDKYVQDPNAQWQGYTDSNKDRAWGVQEWARRTGQGTYFDWVTANALLPSSHPNQSLEGIQKVDRTENSDIAVVSANLNAIQNTFDQANRGENPLGLSGNVVPMDVTPSQIDDLVYGRTHFEQIYDRSVKALENAVAVWDNANADRNRLRQVGNSEAEFRNSTFQEDLSYRNDLIRLFGKPYEGTIGPGQLYPAGYDGPDLLLYMYVDVRGIDQNTVPGPAGSFASFTDGQLTGGDLYDAFVNGTGNESPGTAKLDQLSSYSTSIRQIFSPTFADAANSSLPQLAQSGWFAVNYTDLQSPKVNLANLTNLMPVTAAGYTFQAPPQWGKRLATGELQTQINQMLQQEAALAGAIGEWDGLQGDILRTLRLVNAKLDTAADMRLKNEVFSRIKTITLAILASAEGVKDALEAAEDTITKTFEAGRTMVPTGLPTAGLAFSPGDALAPVRGTFVATEVGVTAGANAALTAIKIANVLAQNGLSIAENELDLFEKRQSDIEAAKEMLVELENKVGDEPIKRIAIFKELQALRDLSDQYRTKVDEGSRLIDQRTAFNKRVASQTQRNRYQDMTFRVSLNHALQTYRSTFNVAARYAYLAAKAYDYETNFEPDDPASPSGLLKDIIRARSLGQFDGEPRLGQGGLCDALAKLMINYNQFKGQLGINNPQLETGKMSLRTENYRILPKAEPTEVVSVEYLTNTTENSTSITTVYTLNGESALQPEDGVYGFAQAGVASDDLWQQTLREGLVGDLWQMSEYRSYCRPFAPETNGTSHVREPGLVLRFSTRIIAGQNFFGRPLGGGDHAYDPSHFATKIRGVGVWFSDYLSGDVLNDLPATPRVYLVPIGTDVMSVPNAADPGQVRLWKVVDQQIPVPLPSETATLDNSSWIPLLDSLSGRMGEARRFPMFRAYHDGSYEVNTDELVTDSRLIGRSVWNTDWMLIIPGRVLNADPDLGLQRFIEQVSDIKLVFETYGFSGN